MSSSSDVDELTQTIIGIVEDEKPQTVRHLVSLVREKISSISEKEALDAVLRLQRDGKLGLVAGPLPASLSLSSYLKRSEAVWFWVTIVLALVTVSLVFLIKEDFYPWVYFRNVFGVVYVLFLPGFTFIRAIFAPQSAKKSPSVNLGNVGSAALSVVMSLALIAIIGLILNFSPWGIRMTPIVFSLLVFTLVFATVAILREYRTRKKGKIA